MNVRMIDRATDRGAAVCPNRELQELRVYEQCVNFRIANVIFTCSGTRCKKLTTLAFARSWKHWFLGMVILKGNAIAMQIQVQPHSSVHDRFYRPPGGATRASCSFSTVWYWVRAASMARFSGCMTCATALAPPLIASGLNLLFFPVCWK